jgi:hypothetical protein
MIGLTHFEGGEGVAGWRSQPTSPPILVINCVTPKRIGLNQGKGPGSCKHDNKTVLNIAWIVFC